MSDTMLFLDLEDTVVTSCLRSFSECTLINSQLIRSFIEELQPSSVNIFSFAIRTEAEREDFEKHLREPLETTFGVKLVLVPTVEEIRKLVTRKRRLHIHDHQEFVDIWGKERGFVEWVDAKFRETIVALVDDDVQDVLIENHTRDNKIAVMNIATLKREWRKHNGGKV